MLTCGDDMICNIGYIFATRQALFSVRICIFPFNPHNNLIKKALLLVPDGK